VGRGLVRVVWLSGLTNEGVQVAQLCANSLVVLHLTLNLTKRPQDCNTRTAVSKRPQDCNTRTAVSTICIRHSQLCIANSDLCIRLVQNKCPGMSNEAPGTRQHTCVDTRAIVLHVIGGLLNMTSVYLTSCLWCLSHIIQRLLNVMRV